MDWPAVTILIITWDRPVEIRRTITALRTNLKYPGSLAWHLADDHSPENYLSAIQADFPDLKFTTTQTDRKGWGSNVNLALQTIQTDYVFSCEDDYVARRKIDLSKGVELMEICQDVGLVRYDGLSGHVGLTLQLQEARKFDKLNYLVILKDKSSHLNVYSHRPHLKRKRFHDAYGLYPEGTTLGECETEFAFKVKQTEGPHLAILDDGIRRAFDHIGKSRQETAQDPGEKKCPKH